jgi:hypothetical protein
MAMDALFIELPAFERRRENYLDDAGFLELQKELLRNPTRGDVIEGTGGLRKMRFRDRCRGKGKRGGLRVVYYYWIAEREFWLFDLYDKDEALDLTPQQRARSKNLLKAELAKRMQ